MAATKLTGNALVTHNALTAAISEIKLLRAQKAMRSTSPAALRVLDVAIARLRRLQRDAAKASSVIDIIEGRTGAVRA